MEATICTAAGVNGRGAGVFFRVANRDSVNCWFRESPMDGKQPLVWHVDSITCRVRGTEFAESSRLQKELATINQARSLSTRPSNGCDRSENGLGLGEIRNKREPITREPRL